MDREEQAWAVFWCSLLAPLRLGEIEETEREAYFRTLAQQEHLLPNGKRRRYSVRTLRRKWRRLKDEGIEGLIRRRRGDRGQARAGREAMLQRAAELKREQPRRSAALINRILRREFGRGVPPSTLYRHLRQQGATRRRLGVVEAKVRCRWTRQRPNALWLGDFAHGPDVIHQGRACQTRLSIWIDCHSRFVLDARYYLRENLDVLIDSLLRAWTKHGVSQELYVDNAKIYHANALKLACAQLSVRLLHRPPREPETGGLVERVIQTLQTQLEAEVHAAKLLSLGDLNRALQAWLGQEYHQAIHSETREAPIARFQREPIARRVDLSEVQRLFHRREVRTVHRTFSDVSVDARFYAVDPKLRGERVQVVINPFRANNPHECPDEVRLVDLTTGAFLGLGRRYQRERGHHEQPQPEAPAEPIQSAYLDALLADAEASQQQRSQDGLDYQSASTRNRLPLSSFLNRIAKLLGRSAGLAALSSEEQDALVAFHARHDGLHEALLSAAVADAESPTIPSVLLRLEFLLRNPGA